MTDYASPLITRLDVALAVTVTAMLPCRCSTNLNPEPQTPGLTHTWPSLERLRQTPDTTRHNQTEVQQPAPLDSDDRNEIKMVIPLPRAIA